MRYTVEARDRLLTVIDREPGRAIPSKNKRENKRGDIRGMSNKSRLRLLRLIASVRRDDPPLFVTLTYRDTWTADPESAWRHLNSFRTLAMRQFPQLAAIWRKQFQERDAPHWHLLAWGSCVEGSAFRAWASPVWCSIIGDESPAALNYAVRADDVDDVRSCGFYLALYTAKQEQQDRRDRRTGREWGVWGRERLGTEPIKTLEANADRITLLRRILRRAYKAQHRRTFRKSLYWRQLGRPRDSFTTFLPLETTSRLLRLIEAEAQADPF